jgi:hypothetical protein
MPPVEDVISTLYENLFSIRLLSTGEQSPSSTMFSQTIRIIPDQSTERLFSDYNISLRLFDDLAVCFIRSRLFAPPAREPKVPFVSFIGEIRIRLLMYVSQNFLNHAVVVANGKDRVYHFSNRLNSVIDSDLFISRPIEVYDAAGDYGQGTIVEEGTQLYQSLAPVFGSESIAISDTEFWQEITPVEQMVNNADLQDASTLEVDDFCFAVIDIYNSGTTNNVYNLFVPGPDNQLRSPVYNLRFKSKIG